MPKNPRQPRSDTPDLIPSANERLYGARFFSAPESPHRMNSIPSTPDQDAATPVAQLTEITHSLTTSLMSSIETLEGLNHRVRQLEDQQRINQLCIAKAMLALGTMAQGIDDEARQLAVFKTLEEALNEIRKPGSSGKP